MRHLTVLLIALNAISTAHAGEIPDLDAFAEKYWNAIRTKESENIYAFYDPRVLQQLTPQESAFNKTLWMEGYTRIAAKQGDSYQITTKALPSDINPFPEMRWMAKPEYQIEIQTFKNVAGGKEGLTSIAEMALRRDGHFYIIRPVPSAEQLQMQMKKKNDQLGAASNSSGPS